MAHGVTRVLITSGGGPGVWGLLHALRHLPNRKAIVLVTDPAAEDTLGTAAADGRGRLAPAAEPAYVDQLLAFCRKNAVEVVIPVYDGELRAVARRRAEFEAIGAHLLLAPTDVVEVCTDKWRTYKYLAGTEFLPVHALAETETETEKAIQQVGYPSKKLCVKPVDLAGGRGLHILDAGGDRFSERMLGKPGPLRCTAEEFLETRRRGPARFRLLLSEFLEGEELGIDLLAEAGRVVEMVVRRKRGPVLHGNPSRIEFHERAGEREWVGRLAGALNLSGLLAIDAMYDAAGRFRLLEVNARPGAYLGMACVARVHLLAWALDRLLKDRSIDPAIYRGARPMDSALRVFADVLIDPDGPCVLEILDSQSLSRMPQRATVFR